MAGENKRNHLNMIQQVISRMGNNSFSLKGWTVGIMIAIFAFAGKSDHRAVVVTLIPIFVFWFMDAYYLMLEKKFRELYDVVRQKTEKEIDFDMNFNNILIYMKDIKKFCYVKIFFSKTVLPFYLVCIITTVIIYLVRF